MKCFINYIKYNIYCIIFFKKCLFITKNILHKYNENDAEQILKDNYSLIMLTWSLKPLTL